MLQSVLKEPESNSGACASKHAKQPICNRIITMMQVGSKYISRPDTWCITNDDNKPQCCQLGVQTSLLCGGCYLNPAAVFSFVTSQQEGSGRHLSLCAWTEVGGSPCANIPLVRRLPPTVQGRAG